MRISVRLPGIKEQRSSRYACIVVALRPSLTKHTSSLAATAGHLRCRCLRQQMFHLSLKLMISFAFVTMADETAKLFENGIRKLRECLYGHITGSAPEDLSKSPGTTHCLRAECYMSLIENARAFTSSDPPGTKLSDTQILGCNPILLVGQDPAPDERKTTQGDLRRRAAGTSQPINVVIRLAN